MLRGSLRVAVVSLGLAVPALAAVAPQASAPARAPVSASVAAVAVVGPTRILRAEFDARADQALGEYQRRTGTALPEEMKPVVRRQLLERLVERNLLILESRRLGTLPSESEAEEMVKQDPFFQEGGRFNLAKFEAVKTSNPALFHNAVEQARENLAARRLNERIQQKSRPDEKQLRERAAAGLGRTSIDYLALRRRDFSGTSPEPREAEVLAYYRSHAAEFQRQDRAVLTLLAVSQTISDSLARTPAGVEAWEKMLRARADSTLRVVRQGARLEDVGRAFGGLRSRVTVEGSTFPAYWRGDARQSASVFSRKAGEVLDELVPSNVGWLIVRVDEAERAHVARLEEAAREIRSRLRDQIRARVEARELQALFDAHRETFKGSAVRVRYAVIDTMTLDPGEPAAQDLDRYYRGHLADFSSFDPAKGTLSAQPFAEVRNEIRERWRRDRRIQLAGERAERLRDAWSRGHRDAAAERAATWVHEVGPVPPGAVADTGLAGRALSDSLQNRQGALGVGVGRYARGTIVFHVTERVPDYMPTLDQIRPRLRAMRDEARSREDEAGARALFDQDPVQFAHGKALHYTQVRIDPPSFMTMTMTHAEVEQYMRQHLDRYSAPELVRVSHILISPKDGSQGADRAARARADSVLARLRAGADFAATARAVSDDEATRDEGGDLGVFGRGAMLEDFERVAFSMRPGDLSGVVHTSVGYHILKCHEYVPAFIQPLPQIYSNVSSDLANDKADSVAARRVDSLYRSFRTPAQARTAFRRADLQMLAQTRVLGESAPNPELPEFNDRLDRVKPGPFYPGPRKEKVGGWSLVWVDSISAPEAPTWGNARAEAIQRYQLGAGQRALDAKRAEIDSMLTSGWSVDSLAMLWGGFEHLKDARAGATLPGLGPADLDSLVFGRDGRAPVLKTGVMSSWIPFPLGLARIRVIEREAPDPEQVAARVEGERRILTERNLSAYYQTLKTRYPVKILDAKLRAVMLPEIPGSPR